MQPNLHQLQPPLIPLEQALAQGFRVIDVRAPIEFAEGRVPGSLNLPLLENEERHLVGIIYKSQGQDAAIEQGYRFLASRTAEIEQALHLAASECPSVILCARGGMRSQVMASLAQRMGLTCPKVIGGYKAYRNYCLQQLAEMTPHRLIVIQGRTGVGKTLLLGHLPQSLDLEGLAQHRGSLFGGVGLTPRGQKDFEALLVKRLTQLAPAQPWFVEGESRKVGSCMLPQRLWTLMNQAEVILVDAPMALRVQRTTEEYVTRQPQFLGRMRDKVASLTEHFGHKGVAWLLDAFDKGDYAACFEKILREYYDPKYEHGFAYGRVIFQVDCSDLAQAALEIQTRLGAA